MRTSRLAKLACKSSLFDDPAVEIGEISGAVREELAAVATGLDALGAAPRKCRRVRRASGIFGQSHLGAIYNSLMNFLMIASLVYSVALAGTLYDRQPTIEVDDGDDDGATTCCKGDRCFRDAYAATAASLVLSGACAAALAKRTRPLYSAAAAAGQA